MFFCFLFFQFRISQVNSFGPSGRVHCVGCDSDFSILFRISVWMEEFVEKILGGKRQADVNKFKAFLDQKVLRRNALQVKVKEAGNKCHIEKPMGGLADFTTRNYKKTNKFEFGGKEKDDDNKNKKQKKADPRCDILGICFGCLVWRPNVEKMRWWVGSEMFSSGKLTDSRCFNF
ncbi:hypothetical protein DAPPUDRAFT_302927 [Daphnia pulex]|uniref:Uncharacterized protein n=1 Tax=Daphnia pulex TaxID=6669 RepID=E9HQ30_DAPPU|nr:hypothetical protein DAPPUDRAFT_302927 [Daphnia pulex]|eukprot:EFX66128.1 hypothetical protein DAPPUDRAFT_302927 [Daphnia pulex]